MSSQLHILHLEDSAETRKSSGICSRAAVSRGEFQRVDSRESFVAALENSKPHLILSDFSLWFSKARS